VTAEVTARFGQQIAAQAREIATTKGVGAYPLNVEFRRTYDFQRLRFAFGSATLSGDYTGEVLVDRDGSFNYNGTAVFNFYDRFTDPYDTFDTFPGEWNPDGTPYDISGSWTGKYAGFENH